MKIKPCPFCGKEPERVHSDCGDYVIYCVNENCPVNPSVNSDMDLPVKAWNTRAIDKDLLAVEGRLKHLLQSDVVRLYDEFDPTISDYKRDISELDHLVFDSKREEKEEKTAHWDICCDGYYPFCSRCGEATQHMSRFCPNCGRKMITRGHDDA